MSPNPPDMKIRLSADLRRKVEEAAKRNNRTMNSEIAARLEASFRDDDGTAPDEIENLRVSLRAEAIERQALESRLHHMELRLRALEGRV